MRLLILIFSWFSLCVHAQQAQWDVVIYMECAYTLHQAAFNNLNQMARSVPQSINLFAIVHDRDTSAWVYRIQRGFIEQLGSVTIGRYASNAILPIMDMVVNDYPAKHHALILWNHGFGILVPYYNETNDQWQLAVDESIFENCQVSKGPFCLRDHKQHKGMLLNSHMQTCMDNQELVELFQKISRDILHGRKLDIVGFDMCKAAMIEHAYQLRNYVDYMIGSQECELTDGWPYQLIFNAIDNSTEKVDAASLAKIIVDSYGLYYKEYAQQGIYTQSACDLKYMQSIKNKLDTILECTALYMEEDQNFCKILQECRQGCRSFCDAPMYMDAYAFFNSLRQRLYEYKDENYLVLARDIADLLELIEHAVIRNTYGCNIAGDVHGLSIYCPRVGIDPSYTRVAFAQESQWMYFCEKLLAVR